MKKQNRLLTLTLTGLATLYCVSSFAADADKPMKKNWLPIAQAIAKVEAQGYSDITSIEREQGQYEVKATNAQGEKIKLYLDRESGEIVQKTNKVDKKDGMKHEGKKHKHQHDGNEKNHHKMHMEK